MAIITLLGLLTDFYSEWHKVHENNKYLAEHLHDPYPVYPIPTSHMSPIETDRTRNEALYSPGTEVKSVRGKDQMEMEMQKYPSYNGRIRSNNKSIPRGSHNGTTS